MLILIHLIHNHNRRNISVCVCVCVCVCVYIHIYMCVCVCVTRLASNEIFSPFNKIILAISILFPTLFIAIFH